MSLQSIKPFIQYALTTAMLVYVVSSTDLSHVPSLFSRLPLWYYPVNFLLYIAVQIVNSLKWHSVYNHASLWSLFKRTMSSQYYALVLPTSLAGDIAKVASTGSDSEDIVVAAKSVLVDKLISLGIVLLLTTASAQLAGDNFAYKLTFVILPLALFAIGALVCVIIVVTQIGEHRLFRKSVTMILARLGIQSTNFGTEQFDNNSLNRITFAKVAALSIIGQFAIAGSYGVASFSFGNSLTPAQLLFVSCATQIVTLLPLSVAGIGLRDLSFVSLVQLFGVKQQVAVDMVIAGYPLLLASIFVSWVFAQMTNFDNRKKL